MTGFIVSVFPFRNRVSSKEAFEGLELGEGKPSRPVLRGPGGRKAAWLLGSYQNARTCRATVVSTVALRFSCPWIMVFHRHFSKRPFFREARSHHHGKGRPNIWVQFGSNNVQARPKNQPSITTYLHDGQGLAIGF